MIAVRYGNDATLELELENDALVTVCDAPRGQRLADLPRELRVALETPLEFPPLSQAALPGDKVVLALEAGVPQAAALVAGAVGVLQAAGVEASDITVLSAAGTVGADELLTELPDEVRSQITALTHNPRDRERLSYLAAAEDASPIYIHRAIHDADLVVSIGALRLPHTLGYHGIHSGIFPTFSDSSTLARFRSPKAARIDEQERLRKQADEVGWLLGTRFTIQVVPGAGNDVLHVLAGDLEAVLAAGGKLCEAAWSFEVPQRVELVVVTIGGDAEQQTWNNLGLALAAAARVLEDDGDIVILSQLDEPPGPGLERIIGADDLQVALREIAREKPADSLPAAQLGRALENGRVYLLSDLAEDRVADLGIYPLDIETAPRVVGRYGTCVILENAQYAQAWPSGEMRAHERGPRKSKT